MRLSFLLPAEFDPKWQVAIDISRGTNPNENNSVPQLFPQCRLFMDEKHLLCRDMRMARLREHHPPPTPSNLSDALFEECQVLEYYRSRVKERLLLWRSISINSMIAMLSTLSFAPSTSLTSPHRLVLYVSYCKLVFTRSISRVCRPLVLCDLYSPGR